MNFISQIKEISRQSVEGMPWFLLTAYSKMWEERYELKKGLLSKKESELKDLENSSPIHIAKNEKVCSKENTKDVAGLSFDKEFMGLYK